MVTRYLKSGMALMEPPYTDDEEREMYAAMAGGPVTMTSVTRPSNATRPVSKTRDRREDAGRAQ